MELLVFMYNDLSYKTNIISVFKQYGVLIDTRPAFIRGKMMKCTNKLLAATTSKRFNQYVYGYLHTIKGEIEVLRCLDGYMGCSLSFLGLNHSNDLMHRQEVETTVISFDSLDTFLQGKYEVGKKHSAYAYFANPEHYRIGISLKDPRNYIGSLTSIFFNAYYENNF